MNKFEQKSIELAESLKRELGEIELDVATNYRLSDAIREGSTVTDQAYNWGDGSSACALSAACIAATARGYIQ